MFKHYRLWLCCLLAILSCLHATAAEVVDRNKLMTEVAFYLSNEKYEQLEKLHQQLIKPNERFSSGTWKLYWYGQAITHSMQNTQDPGYWDGLEKVAAQWQRKVPNSSAAPLFLARVHLQHAWAIRGGGYASTISDEDLAQVYHYSDLAITVLQKDARRLKRNPDWFPAMLDALALQSPRATRFDAILAEGARLHPTYQGLYFTALNYLQPKWGGTYQRIEQMALTASQDASNLEAKALYARIYWSLDGRIGGKIFSDSKVQWKLMKPSFDALIETYPDNWNLNAYAYFACGATDAKTLRTLLTRIAGKLEYDAWGPMGKLTYSQCVEFMNDVDPDQPTHI